MELIREQFQGFLTYGDVNLIQSEEYSLDPSHNLYGELTTTPLKKHAEIGVCAQINGSPKTEKLVPKITRSMQGSASYKNPRNCPVINEDPVNGCQAALEFDDATPTKSGVKTFVPLLSNVIRNGERPASKCQLCTNKVDVFYPWIR